METIWDNCLLPFINTSFDNRGLLFRTEFREKISYYCQFTCTFARRTMQIDVILRSIKRQAHRAKTFKETSQDVGDDCYSLFLK